MEHEDAVLDLKISVIRDIHRLGERVHYVIHRHNIPDEEQAYQVEAALIDAYPGLTNLVGGHASAEYGCRSVRQIIEAYAAEPLVPKEDLILIFVGRALEEKRSIYNATRAAWRMNKSKAEKYRLVLAYDSNGLVVGAFRPDKWMQATKANFDFLQEDEPNRIGFSGKEARGCNR